MNWSAVSGSDGNNSGVTYTITNTPGAANYTVTYGTPANTGVRGETAVYSDAQSHTIGAATTIDPQVTNPDSLLELMAHEIGHPAGLGECVSCAVGDSVMANGPPPGQYNAVVGRPAAPTRCDNSRLQQSDYPYCHPPVSGTFCDTYDPNTCTCSESSGDPAGGTGTENQTGSCTPYYLVTYISFDGGNTWSFEYASYLGCY
jgi:hypothetical protein